MEDQIAWLKRFLTFVSKAIDKRFFSSAFVLLSIVFISKAQDPNLPPGENFDLSKWKITLPDQSEPSETDLVNGFESEDEFYTDPNTGAMVFKCPNNGQTGGSTYPRSELREMLRAGNTSISTKGIGLNNWVFSSSTVENQMASGGVDGTMTATVAVDHVSTTGESNKIGRVIIGQIHASDDEPCRLYYRKLPGNSKGSIYIAHEPTTSSEQWYEMIGSRSSSASDPSDGIALGEKFSYEIKVVFNTLTVTIIREGKADVVQEVDMTNSGFADDWMYFKAGNYNQNNSGDEEDYAQVSFFELDVTHSAANMAPSVNITSPSNNDTFTEGQNIEITANASDSDGSISKVEFFEGSNKLGEDVSSPYSIDWQNVAEGNYTLTAVATDNIGTTTTSSGISIAVDSQPSGYDAPSDIPKFQPFLAGCKLQAPTSATIASQSVLNNGFTHETYFMVADGDKIAFNQSGESMRTELRHETNWIISEGDRSLHGRLKIVEQTCDQVTVVQIHDDANAGSGPNKPLLRIYKHQTRPPENHLWAAVKTDVGGSNTTHVDLGLAPTDYFSFDVRLVGGSMIIDIDGEEKANVDVSFWNFPSYWKAGVYLQDDGEATAYFDELYEGNGTPVNHSPSVSITSPTHDDSFKVGDNITISADASDTDGTISKVEFYEGNNKLGEDNTAPYSITWNDVQVGNYTLTARATDNESALTTSLGVDVLVGIQYTLDISTTGQGSVTTTSSGTDYPENAVVNLRATPDEGYLFNGWGGDLTGRQNPVNITMDSDKSVIANFIPTYTLTTSVMGGGSITLSPSGGTYEEGAVVTLTAIPDSGKRLESWSGDASGSENQTTVTMNANKSVSATFGIALSVDEPLDSDKELTAYPNPFDSMTTIQYTLSDETEVEISIYDLMGKKVKELVNTSQKHGDHTIEWAPNKDLLNGVYFIKMRKDDKTTSRKVILSR